MRLHIENLQLQIDDLERHSKPKQVDQDEDLIAEIDDLRKENNQLSQVLERQEHEINELEEKSKEEERSMELEEKLKEVMISHEAEVADLEADLKVFKAKCDRFED